MSNRRKFIALLVFITTHENRPIPTEPPPFAGRQLVKKGIDTLDDSDEQSVSRFPEPVYKSEPGDDRKLE